MCGSQQLAGDASEMGLHRTAAAGTDVCSPQRLAGPGEFEIGPVEVSDEAGTGCGTGGMMRLPVPELVSEAGHGDCGRRVRETAVPDSCDENRCGGAESSQKRRSAVRPS